MKKRTFQLCSAILLICLILSQTGCIFDAARSVFSPTPVPTQEIQATQTPAPTDVPAATATGAPTATPTAVPAATATGTPTATPADVSVITATGVPTATPADNPTGAPTSIPTNTPTPVPTSPALLTPSTAPVNKPTSVPTSTPTPIPTNKPTSVPTSMPTPIPTNKPTPIPTSTSTPIPTSTSTPIPTSTSTPIPTSTSTPIPTSTPVVTPEAGHVTPAPNVSFSVKPGISTFDYGVTDSSISSVDKVFADYLSSLQKNQGYSFQRFYIMADADEAITVANKLIGYGGISQITVKENTRYANASQFEISLDSRCSFIYYYAAKSGDRNGLISEEIKTLDKILELVNNAKKLKSDYEKELYFHDWLVKNIAYGNPDVGLESRNKGKKLGGQTPYEALILGECVCAGYSSSFELLMNLSGIETVYVTGWAGESHAWNRVKLEGKWYNVDVTWDDPFPNVEGRVIYTYFNVPDEFLLQDHTPDDKSLPKATETKYNYYAQTCTPCETQADVNAYCAEMKQKGETVITVLFTGTGDIDIYEVSGALNCGFSYSPIVQYPFGKILIIYL